MENKITNIFIYEIYFINLRISKVTGKILLMRFSADPLKKITVHKTTCGIHNIAFEY